MSIDPSPFLPQTTMAIDNVKMAANAAQANVNNIASKLEVTTISSNKTTRQHPI